MFAFVERSRVEQRKVDLLNIGLPSTVAILVTFPISSKEFLTKHISMIIKQYQSIGHVHMGSTEALVGNDPFTVKAFERAFLQERTSQDMTCTKTKENSIWLSPTSFRILFHAGNGPVHSGSLSFL